MGYYLLTILSKPVLQLQHFLRLLSGQNGEGQSKDECMKGKSTAEVEAELRAAGKSEDDIKSIGPHKEFKV